jgi:hypothetical protein
MIICDSRVPDFYFIILFQISTGPQPMRADADCCCSADQQPSVPNSSSPENVDLNLSTTSAGAESEIQAPVV